MARRGAAGRGKAWVVTKRLRLVVGYIRRRDLDERCGKRGIWPITWRKPAVRWTVFLTKEPEKEKIRTINAPGSRHYQPGATLNFQETIWS
jgi:hypothetical protein